MANFKYNELSKAKIQPNRNIVISAVEKSNEFCGFTLAQQLEVREGNKKTNVFFKNAIIVEDIAGLYNIRDAINVAIEEFEKEQTLIEEFEKEESLKNNEDWDA